MAVSEVAFEGQAFQPTRDQAWQVGFQAQSLKADVAFQPLAWQENPYLSGAGVISEDEHQAWQENAFQQGKNSWVTAAFQTAAVSPGNRPWQENAVQQNAFEFPTTDAPVARVLFNLDPVAIATAEVFGVSHPTRILSPVAVASAYASGLVNVRFVLEPVGVVTREAFGQFTINRLYVTGIASAEAFGQAAHVLFVVKPVAIASSTAFGTVKAARLTGPVGVGSGEAFGKTNVLFLLYPLGVVSGEAWGRPTLQAPFAGITVTGVGAIDSLAAFGVPNVRFLLYPLGAVSGLGFGVPHPSRVARSTAGISSAEAFGQADRLLHLLNAVSLVPDEAFGIAHPTFIARSSAGIVSGEAFGPADRVQRALDPQGIIPASAFGTVKVVRFLFPLGSLSTEAWGQATVTGGVQVTFPTLPGGVLLSDHLTFEVMVIDGELYGAFLETVPFGDASLTENELGGAGVSDAILAEILLSNPSQE